MICRAAAGERRCRRRGLALPAALVALLVISLLVSGSAFLVMQEARSSHDALSERRALEAAEYGATAVLRDWDAGANLSAPVGARLGPWSHALAGGAAARVHAVRATPTTFWVISEGTAGAAGTDRSARRVVSALLRLDVPEVRVRAALTVRDSASVLGSGLVMGADSTVGAGSLSCPSGPALIAGIAAPDTTRICDGTCGAPSARVQGTPPLSRDSAASDPRWYQTALSGPLAALVARADLTLPAGAVVTPTPLASGGACQRGVPSNWGDLVPASPCEGYWPVIHALGDVTMAGGVGHGILIAEGDVRIGFGATFVGLVVAGDDIVTLTGGGMILGAALAGDAVRGISDHSRIGDRGTIRYSACGVRQALFAAAPIRRVRSRWWAELF